MNMCNCNQVRLPCTCNAQVPFRRENRYIVIKLKDLAKVPVSYRSYLVDPVFALQAHLPNRECLVIESDWPEYEPTWAAIEARMTGIPPVTAAETAAEELNAVLHWRGKHALAIKERDQLQQDLTQRDERLDKADDDFALLSLEAGQRMELLEGLLLRWSSLLGTTAPELADETQQALKPAAVGVNSGITGMHADLAILDEFHWDSRMDKTVRPDHAPAAPSITIPRGIGEYDGLDNGVD